MFYYFLTLFILFLSCSNTQNISSDQADTVAFHSDVKWTRINVIDKGELVYPDSLKNAGVVGRTWVECIIDTSGNIASKKVLSSSDNRLNMAALQTVSGYKFSPGTLNDKKNKGKITLLIEFK